MNFNFDDFIRERNEALRTMDMGKILAYMFKYRIPAPNDETVFWAGLHKARCHITDMPEELKAESRAWLEAHGMSAEIRWNGL